MAFSINCGADSANPFFSDTPILGRSRDDFQRHVARFGNVTTRWKAAALGWILFHNGATQPRPVPGTIKVLNSVPLKALGQLAAGDEEPWALWLEVMRYRQAGTADGQQTAMSLVEWDGGLKEGLSLNEVRRKLKLSISDEEEPHRWLRDQQIENVFQAAADFCEQLSAEAMVSARSHSDGKYFAEALDRRSQDADFNAESDSISGGGNVANEARRSPELATQLSDVKQELRKVFDDLGLASVPGESESHEDDSLKQENKNEQTARLNIAMSDFAVAAVNACATYFIEQQGLRDFQETLDQVVHSVVQMCFQSVNLVKQ